MIFYGREDIGEEFHVSSLKMNTHLGEEDPLGLDSGLGFVCVSLDLADGGLDISLN